MMPPRHRDIWSQEPIWVGRSRAVLVRAWSGRTVEATNFDWGSYYPSECDGVTACHPSWTVISSPNEGLNARADINFDSRVNAEDLGIMLAAWGDAPRNDYPPSDCPLGLIP